MNHGDRVRVFSDTGVYIDPDEVLGENGVLVSIDGEWKIVDRRHVQPLEDQ